MHNSYPLQTARISLRKSAKRSWTPLSTHCLAKLLHLAKTYILRRSKRLQPPTSTPRRKKLSGLGKSRLKALHDSSSDPGRKQLSSMARSHAKLIGAPARKISLKWLQNYPQKLQAVRWQSKMKIHEDGSHHHRQTWLRSCPSMVTKVLSAQARLFLGQH